MIKYCLLPLIVLLTGCRDTNNPEVSKDNDLTVTNSTINTHALRHIVLFKFKEGASADSINLAIEAFKALPAKIETIRQFEWGTNNSPENLNKGFTHCFQLTFNSQEDRSVYLPHPDHQAFGQVLGPVLDDVLVFDYWAEEISKR